MKSSGGGKESPPAAAVAEAGYSVRWSDRAESDLQAIYDYIARDNPDAASRWVDKLLDRAEKAAFVPLAGRAVPELQTPTIREVFVRTYRIVYRVRGREIHILTVFEGHRLLPENFDSHD